MILSGMLPATAGSGPLGSDLSGMVWERHGDWHLNGGATELRLGEAMPPGGLLTAGNGSSAHSLVVLLPNGQRMLCECYDPQHCAQGFRIPAITPPPAPAVWDTFVAVRNVLLLRPAAAVTAFPVLAGRAAMAANFEMVAAVGPQGDLSIAPSLRVLPSGQYSLSVAWDGHQAGPAAQPTPQPLDWTAGQSAAQVKVAGPGLYRIRVTDQAHVPRLEIEVLATSPDSLAPEAARLKEVRQTVQGWNHTRGGWSLHDFLRAYLQSRAN